MEWRSCSLELRAHGRRLVGTAALFGVETRIGSITESIRPGAFASSLRNGSDVLLLADHDVTKVLARTKAGSLKLSESAKGLEFETGDLPNTTAANDTIELVRSGNAGGMSFGFSVLEDIRDKGRRELVKVDLREVSVVSSWPAYPSTSVMARARMDDATKLKLARMFMETV